MPATGLLNSVPSNLPNRIHQDGVYGVAKVTYDYAVHGGAVGDISLDLVLPSGAIVYDGIVDVLTAPLSGGSATVALKIQSSADLLGATAKASFTGMLDLVPAGTAATALKLTADRTLKVTVATAALTAGKFNVYIKYFLP